MQERQFWFDLEETIISSWDEFLANPERAIVNGVIIDDFIKTHSIRPDEIINIFSFAVWNQEDKEIFNRLKGVLENRFGVKFVCCLTLRDIANQVKKARHISKLDDWELINFMGKQTMFIDFMRYKDTKNMNIFLLDDVVEDMTIRYYDLNTFIHCVNVTKWFD